MYIHTYIYILYASIAEAGGALGEGKHTRMGGPGARATPTTLTCRNPNRPTRARLCLTRYCHDQ